MPGFVKRARRVSNFDLYKRENLEMGNVDLIKEGRNKKIAFTSVRISFVKQRKIGFKRRFKPEIKSQVAVSQTSF